MVMVPWPIIWFKMNTLAPHLISWTLPEPSALSIPVLTRTYKEIINMYVDYVLKNFGKAIVVFDGYGSPSTKDQAHIHRTKRICATVNFSESMPASRLAGFLDNPTNKTRFITMLADALRDAGCEVDCSEGDADLDIVLKATAVGQKSHVVLVGNDTDLLVLLLHHWKSREGTRCVMLMQTSQATHALDVGELQQRLDADLLKTLLFVHAVCGCDSTSRLFGVGKVAAAHKLKQISFLESALVFSRDATREEVATAGTEAIAVLYGAEAGTDLNSLRYQRFREKVAAARGSAVQVRTLPPTSAAAQQHAFRVNLQVKQWMGMQLNPTDWGWRVSGNQLVPIHSELPPAPQPLLRSVRCKCTSGCEPKSKCTCRRYGLACSTACTGCCSGCSICPKIIDDDANRDELDGELM